MDITPGNSDMCHTWYVTWICHKEYVTPLMSQGICHMDMSLGICRTGYNRYPNLLEEPKYRGEKFGFKPSVLQNHVSGTDFLLNSRRLVHWTHSRNILRHICFKNITTQKINSYYLFLSILYELHISYCMLWNVHYCRILLLLFVTHSWLRYHP